MFWAVENTLSKYVLREVPSRAVVWARMFFGSLFIFIFFLFTGQFTLLSGLTLAQIGWVFITSVILFGYVMTWYSGLKYIPVSKAAVILLLGSPITTLLSFIWTGQITIQVIFASFLIIFGVALIFGLREFWYIVKKIKNLCPGLN